MVPLQKIDANKWKGSKKLDPHRETQTTDVQETDKFFYLVSRCYFLAVGFSLLDFRARIVFFRGPSQFEEYSHLSFHFQNGNYGIELRVMYSYIIWLIRSFIYILLDSRLYAHSYSL